jgi:hypothetical protein
VVKVDAAPGFAGLDAERDTQEALAGARRADEVQNLGAIDELELRPAP